MENEILLAATIDERIILAEKNKEILEGKIVSIRKNNDIILSVNIVEGQDPIRVTMPYEYSTLYIPNGFKRIDENGEEVLTAKGKNYLKDYLGSNVSFIIKENRENDGPTTDIKVSMTLARTKTIKELVNRKLPFRIKVNVISAKPNFLIVEYKGIVQTVAEQSLSYAEIPSVKDFYLRNKNNINEFAVIDVNKVVNSITLDRKPIIGDIFKKKVLTDQEYAVGDSVVGKVIGKTNNNQMILEIEPEILAMAYIPDGLKIKLNDEIKGTISSIRMKKSIVTGEKRGKLLLSNVRL